MTYQEAMDYMEQVQKKGSILGTKPVKALLERLNYPQNQLKVIHVAGTNGKGSICTFLEYLYREEGKRVGRYISPVLHSYLERFQINGNHMSEDEFTGLLEIVQAKVEEMKKEGEDTPTAFEIETVIAFLYFVQKKVDIVILETGMGGRLDATNVVDHPMCTVFASIGMDHMQFLGDTIEKIASEKAGIMKKGCPVVSYPNTPVVMGVLEKEFGLHNAECEGMPSFLVVHKSDVLIISESLEGSTFLYKGKEYQISMAGEYQIYNAVTAIETKLLLDEKIKEEGLLKAHWEGRFEKISNKPLFIKDGAHNVDGVKALKKSIEKHFTKEHLLFIIGVLRDKEYDKMMGILCPLADTIYTITPENERGLSGEELKESILPYCGNVVVCDSLEKAVASAKSESKQIEQKGESAAIIAWGSLSYIGQIRG